MLVSKEKKQDEHLKIGFVRAGVGTEKWKCQKNGKGYKEPNT
jgi:hypothetical protein